MSEKDKERKIGVKGADYHFPSLEDELRLARRRGLLGDAIFTHISSEEAAAEYDRRTPEEHARGMRIAQKIIDGTYDSEKDDSKEE